MRRVFRASCKVQLLYSTMAIAMHTKVLFAHDTFHMQPQILNLLLGVPT